MIHITMTATRRSEILERTLKSFKMLLFKYTEAQLILNIDPVGPYPIADTYSIAKKYFPIAIRRIPANPHFGAAFKWTWEWANTPFVFNLEDDWELLRPVRLNHMMAIMKDNPDLAVLRLPWKSTGYESMKNWRYFFPWNGQFFECPNEIKREVGFCGHPSLIRYEFILKVVGYLDPTKNPEKQFHHGSPEMMAEIDRWRYGVYAGQNQPPAIRDIGRQWMVEQGYKKAGNKAFFTEWEEVK